MPMDKHIEMIILPFTMDLKRPKASKNKIFPNIIWIGLGLFLLFNLLNPPKRPDQITYSEFKEKIAGGAFAKVQITEGLVIGELKSQATASDDKPSLFNPPNTHSSTILMNDQELIKLLDQHKTAYEFKIQNNFLRDFLLSWVLPIGLMFLLWNFMFRKMGPGSSIMSFGKNKSRLKAESELKTTFNDVAGQDEAKHELIEIVDFLKEPKRFTQLGGKLPKGVLLVGPPGTGKTLLARAVAGEAKVPFFNISGSEFVEMFVGVGAARVRDLFEQAKSKAPCIIFIDELDAIGKARGMAVVGGHDEREQTLNQLLVEMDGFDSKAGVVIMAATNRPEILDQALLRAGRFDRQVLVGRPDVKEREAILVLHAKKVKLSQDVNLLTVAKSTPGMVGADLANVVNEAALLAARYRKSEVQMADFQEAVERILTGLEKKKRVINKHEKEVVAHHEAGHAIVATLKKADRVHKISIIPRGIGALGFTMQLPTEDRYLMTQSELTNKIDVLLGGQAAEKIIFNEISTGASDDLQRATQIARSMITIYGMGQSLGPTTLDRDRTPMYMDQGQIASGKNFSEETAKQVDEEIKTLMKSRMQSVQKILQENLALLKDVAGVLLEKETLNETQFDEIVAKHIAPTQI